MIDLGQNAQPRDPLQARISTASDRIQANTWLPPQWAGIARIRFGERWVNVLWIVSHCVCRPGTWDREPAAVT